MPEIEFVDIIKRLFLLSLLKYYEQVIVWNNVDGNKMSILNILMQWIQSNVFHA